MRPITGGVCATCGERLFSPYAVAAAPGEPRCGLCRRVEPAFVRAVAYGSYESGLRELIHLLKFGGVRPAANVLGRMLAEAIATLELEFPAGLSGASPRAPAPQQASPARLQSGRTDCARRDENQPAAGSLAFVRRSTRENARNRIANWPHQPSAPREPARCFRSDSARIGEGPRSAGGGRRLHHGRDRFGMRAGFAPRRRNQGLGRNRGAHLEDLGAACGDWARRRRPRDRRKDRIGARSDGRRP